MSRYQDNTAIQYERFPVEQPSNQQQQQLEVLPSKSTRARKAVLPYGKYAVIMACVFVVLIGIVTSYMRLATINLQNAQLRQDIAKLESDANALNAKKEQMYNLTFVEDYAKNQLGMVKMDKSQVNYLEMDTGDRMVLSASARDAAQTGAGFFARLTEGVRQVLEYLN